MIFFLMSRPPLLARRGNGSAPTSRTNFRLATLGSSVGETQESCNPAFLKTGGVRLPTRRVRAFVVGHDVPDGMPRGDCLHEIPHRFYLSSGEWVHTVIQVNQLK